MTKMLLVTLYYCEKCLKKILAHTSMLFLQNKIHRLIMLLSGTQGQTGSLSSSNYPHVMLVLVLVPVLELLRQV